VRPAGVITAQGACRAATLEGSEKDLPLRDNSAARGCPGSGTAPLFCETKPFLPAIGHRHGKFGTPQKKRILPSRDSSERRLGGTLAGLPGSADRTPERLVHGFAGEPKALA
jgi:hypothetical protein